MSAAREPKRWRGMCVLAEYAPDEILPLRGDHDHTFLIGDFPISVPMDDSRYRIFAQSKCCCSCGLTGTVMRLEYSFHPRGWIEPHFNLYALNNNGTYVLMTQDHIIPKSRGGNDEDSNLRTMCSPCNEKKGNKVHVETGTEGKPVWRKDNHSQKRAVRLEGVLDDVRYHSDSNANLHLSDNPNKFF